MQMSMKGESEKAAERIFCPFDKFRLTRTNVRITIQIPTRIDNARRQLNIPMRAHVAPKKKCGDG